MIDQRERFERTFGLFDMPEPALERLVARRRRKDRNRRIGTALVALVLAVAGIGGLGRALSSGTDLAAARSLFVGTWVSTDADGSTQTMTIRASGDDAVEMLLHDDAATGCSGAPATMAGTGRLDGTSELVIPSPSFTCDDGSEPQAASGAPLEEQDLGLTFVHDAEADTLTDNLGTVWGRGDVPEGSGGMWPQSSLEEVREAQDRADAGDPRYTWQVLPEWPPYGPGGPRMEPRDAEIFDRFLQEKLGWAEFSWGLGPSLYPPPDWPWEFVVVRCAPGRTNPLYANDPDGRECAPTLDKGRYETVKIGADQPARDGDAGVWVVTRWVMLQPSDGPITGIGDFFQHQVEQVEPPSDAEARELVNAFLESRVAGEGAERYLHPDAEQFLADQCSVHTSESCGQIPLLYATTSGAPYERFEFELVEGPVWPGGWMEFEVRLFAESGRTVVEQPFLLDRGEDRRLGLVYQTLADGTDVQTTENGEAVGLPYELLEGEVTFFAPRPWYEFFDYGPRTIALHSGDFDEALIAVLADPRPVETGCEKGPAPADAEALARSIRNDPDLEATEPVAVPVGGINALRMDVVAAAGASVCDDAGTALVVSGPGGDSAFAPGPSLERRDRMRLYLLDLPGESSAGILAIAFVAPEAGFETSLEEAESILDTFEFHAP